eukprot:CAMPEP_0184311728 /NCGR_PEP_ID=MMETSP1049-20130417/44555_1 /TAXON_ID=77928 /ORGANISM="Proteomonas sulcata, Strain CCMP704" /LENGTH=43 /DNA_ID= /DNA_START= /DNA_END= /DNA_ORIENTATION=
MRRESTRTSFPTTNSKKKQAQALLQRVSSSAARARAASSLTPV